MDGRSRRALKSRENRRQQLLDTALIVFSEQGYHRTSISDLVSAAGVARGTFYQYFDSKEAVFRDLLAEVLRHFRGNIVGVDMSEGAEPVTRQLERTVTRILQTAVDNRDLTRIVFREAVGLDPVVDEQMRTFYASLVDFTRSALQVGQHLDLIRQDLDTDVAALCILGAVRQILVAYVVESDVAFDVGGVAKAALDFNLRGVRATD